MKRLESDILRACAELDLSVEFHVLIMFENERPLQALAKIATVGAAKGMLVFLSYETIRNSTEKLLDAGFGFTILDEPASEEEFDLESFKTMIRDWGWAGPPDKKPGWMG
jgi:hypothetical protein